MSRLPVITSREAVAALKRGGFVESHQTGSHLFLRHPVTKRTTVVPMHTGDLKRGTIKGVLRLAGLTDEQFQELL